MKFAAERLDKISYEILHEFYVILKLDTLVPLDYLERMIRVHIE